jgi:O-antigen/teichoic acid export membrane protein
VTVTAPERPRYESGWALATVVVALAAGLVRTLAVARWLDPAEIGVMGVALLAFGFAEAVSSTGVDTALVAARREVEDDLDPAFTLQLARGVGVSGLLWLAAPALALAFHAPGAVQVIRTVGLVAALRGLANPAVALVVRRLEFRRVFWWALPEVLTALGVTLALAFWHRDAWALAYGMVAGAAVGTLASYALVPRMPRLVFARERIMTLLRFGGWVSGSRALMYFSVNLDFAFIALTLGTRALGLYQLATRVAEIPIVTVTKAVSQVALPALTGVQESAEALRRTWRRMLTRVFAANTAAAVLILLFASSAVPALLGRQWQPAVGLMRVLAVAMVFRGVIILAGQLFDASGRPALTLWLNGARLALVVVLMPPLAGWGGAMGIALAVLGASAFAALLGWRLSARVLPGRSPGLSLPASLEPPELAA